MDFVAVMMLVVDFCVNLCEKAFSLSSFLFSTLDKAVDALNALVVPFMPSVVDSIKETVTSDGVITGGEVAGAVAIATAPVVTAIIEFIKSLFGGKSGGAR